ncbi:MAG: DUF975 family protein [Paludibacteraceae bacterium]|nr:DUF975 family protein [Paludibacteraceae bacterium]
MKTPYEYRAQAREVLQNRWGEAAIVSAIILVLACAISMPSVIADTSNAVKESLFGSSFTTLLAVLIVPIQYAFYIVLLELTRSKEEALLHATWQHTKRNYTNLLLAGLLITILSSLLAIVTFGIGAIILSYAYRMVPYLLHDYPELTPREALKISREMMSGHKWELFVLDFSFIGWILLSIITCGVGTLFLVPYMQTATAYFYEDLRAATIVEENDEPTL